MIIVLPLSFFFLYALANILNLQGFFKFAHKPHNKPSNNWQTAKTGGFTWVPFWNKQGEIFICFELGGEGDQVELVDVQFGADSILSPLPSHQAAKPAQTVTSQGSAAPTIPPQAAAASDRRLTVGDLVVLKVIHSERTVVHCLLCSFKSNTKCCPRPSQVDSPLDSLCKLTVFPNLIMFYFYLNISLTNLLATSNYPHF